MEQLEKLLWVSGNRLTKARRQVFGVLEKAERPLSLQEILGRVGAIDRTSVYRTLELFAGLSIIEIVHVGWKKRYELASPFKPHHHHLQCIHCEQLIALDNSELEHTIDRLAAAYGYELTAHHIELSGVCPACQNAPKSQEALVE